MSGREVSGSVFLGDLGGKCPEGKCLGRVFFLEGIVREGTIRGGAVRGGKSPGGNCPGGNFPGGNLPVTQPQTPQ